MVCTPLHAAIYIFSEDPATEKITEEIVEELINAGANPLAQNTSGITPWDHYVSVSGEKRTNVYWLLNDARFNIPEDDSSQ